MDETQKFDPEQVKEAAQPDLEQTQAFDTVEEFTLDDILKEFGEAPAQDLEQTQEFAPVEALEQTQEFTPVEDPEQTREEAPATGDTQVLPDISKAQSVTTDTVRLDAIDQAELQVSMVSGAQVIDDEEDAKETVDPYTASWEPEYDQPMGEYVPPQPIQFRPRSRIKELKKKLVNGPEKQYYKLMEKGVGKLQVAIFFSVLLVVLSGLVTAIHALGWLPADRVKFMIFLQLLSMLIAALLGSFQLVEGIADLLKKRFSMNTLLVFTFLACCADGVLCLMDGNRIPCCAAFSLSMTMSLWSTYHKRYTQMGQMDTLRKATRLDGVGVTEEFYEGERGLLRFEGQVEDFMDEYYKIGGPEKRMHIYSLVALFASLGVAIAAAVLQFLRGGVWAAVTGGVQVLAVTMLAALPASAFIAVTRPFALLEKRLHRTGTVICGWKGVNTLCGKAVFPVSFADLFPAGTVKLNGVKFYGSRQPDEIVAYCAAVMEADQGGLAPIFAQLLASRNGRHYDVQQLRDYENGGIGGIVNDEAVLVGSISFLKEMGVEIPEGVQVSNAVCIAVDGELCGLFAINYEKDRSSGAGMATLCSYRGLKVLLTAHDFSLTPEFLKNKFGVGGRGLVLPDRQTRQTLAQVEQAPGTPAAVLVTGEGLAPFAYGVTGARALRSASNLGVAIHLIGGILGVVIMLVLAVLGQLQLLTPANMFLYHLVWLIPGFLTTEWTRSI